MEGIEHFTVGLAEFLQLVLFAQLEEIRHLPDAFFARHGREGVVDACLQVGFAAFAGKVLRDKYVVDPRETLVQEGDIPAVFFGVALLVKNGGVISFADAVDDFGGLVAGGYSHEHATGHFGQVVDSGTVISYIYVI